MKYIYLLFFVYTFSHASEMQRMESIVHDIQNLRAEYASCTQALEMKNTQEHREQNEIASEATKELQTTKKKSKEYQSLLEKERMKNTSLLEKIEDFKRDKSNRTYDKIQVIKENKLFNSENQSKYKNIIEKQKKRIDSLRNQIKNTDKTISVEKELCEEENTFPQLLMKKTERVKEIKKVSKAKTFRLNKDSVIYDDVDGSHVYRWEKRTSFTSAKETKNWLEVTGYFKNAKWLRAKQDLWLEKTNATARYNR